VRKVHAKHGRDHGPDGFDPIPDVGGAGQWCRIYYDGSPVNVDPGARDVVEFGTVNNPYPAYFDTDQAELVADSAITILQSGTYAFTYRLYCSAVPDVPFVTEMNGIDWDEWQYYERTHDAAALTGFGAHDSYIFRSDGTYGLEPPKLYVIASVPAAATDPLVIDDGTAGHRAQATYLEIIRLAPGLQTGSAEAA
jgi:hypothetical protein